MIDRHPEEAAGEEAGSPVAAQFDQGLAGAHESGPGGRRWRASVRRHAAAVRRGEKGGPARPEGRQADPRWMKENLRHFREQTHAHCVVCGADNPQGLQLSFRAAADGSVQAVFAGRRVLEGYAATLHGGIICSLLDGAMTNCLAAHGHQALTAELVVRFRRPVATERPATIRAWIENSGHQLHHVAADLRQDGQVMASATAKFMECNDDPGGAGQVAHGAPR